MAKNRLVVAVMVTLAAVAVFMFVGLPFGQFNLTNVRAQYGPLLNEAAACGGVPTLQGRWGNTGLALFIDKDLKQFALQVPVRSNLKLLICPNGIFEKSVRVFYVGVALYAPLPPSIVSRGLQDNQ